MSNIFLHGREVKDEILDWLKNQIRITGRTPKLVILQVGDNPASNVYVGNKLKAAIVCGINAEVRKYPMDVTQEQLVQVINKLNLDHSVDGIIVQLPLPKHINEMVISEAIATKKDVDGFNNQSQGGVVTNSLVTHRPCTPKGILALLNHYGISLEGKDVVIVGRSNIVGKPLSLMMINEGATVTVCHTKTLGLKDKTRNADIVVLATGQLKQFNSEYFNNGQVIIDVGIGRDETGKLCGDLDTEDVNKTLDELKIVPSPGGCGQTTVAMLMTNTFSAMMNC